MIPDWVRTLKQSTRWFAREIWRRNGLWVLVAFLAALGVVVSAFHARPSIDRPGGAVWGNIVLNLCTAFLAAALLEIFSQIGEIYRIDRNQRALRQLFGFDDRGASVAVVLPKFDVGAQQIWNKQVPGWGDLKDHGHAIAPNQELIGVAVQADIIAASDLIAMFSAAHLETPRLMWDDVALAEYENLSSRFKTFITIGIASNALAMEINHLPYGPRWFKLDDTPPNVLHGEGVDVVAVWTLRLAKYHHAAVEKIKDPTKWESFQYTSDENWGLISKVTVADKGKCVFLLAGMHSDGTKRLGEFIAQNFSSIRKWEDNVSKIPVGDNCFASVVDIPASLEGPIGGRRKQVVVHSKGTDD